MKLTMIFLGACLSVLTLTGHTQQLLSTSTELPTEDIFALHMQVDRDVVISEIAEQQQRIDDFVLNIKSEFDREDREDMLEELFYTGHKKFLKHYRLFTTFNDLLSKGRYDCLTGTIFYAYALNQLDFSFEIVETPHHIYILVEDGEYLLESTDPLNGFVAGKEAVMDMLENDRPAEGDSEEVSFYETVGLQYYNAAVYSMNNGKLLDAVDHVENATFFYQGERMIQLGLILSRAISESEMDADTKFSSLLKLTRTIQSRVQVVGLN